MSDVNKIIVPRYFEPRPYQQEAWLRRKSGKYRMYICLWSRRLGKDTLGLQFRLWQCWNNPGTKSVYVGLDNGWIKENIFKMNVAGRTHWMDYPQDMIEVKETDRRVTMNNNPKDLAAATVKFIGFLNDEALIGSGYDFWEISEYSLYPRRAFAFIQPIWDAKIAQGETLEIGINSTPRGMNNGLYDFLKTFTGKDDPADFPGEHYVPSVGWIYVDKLTSATAYLANGERVFSDNYLERLRDRYIREYGNDQMFRQEHMVDFLAVNAGLVYKGIEVLRKEKRYVDFNIDPEHPLYLGWDIATKGANHDWSCAIVFQYINNKMMIYDHKEWHDPTPSIDECMAELREETYFKFVRFGFLPWDAATSTQEETLQQEMERKYPVMTWHSVHQTKSIMKDIGEVRTMLGNMVIRPRPDQYGEDFLMEAFDNYEFRRLEHLDDWGKPIHNQYSHVLDALRTAVMGIKEAGFYGLEIPDVQVFGTASYKSFYGEEEEDHRLNWQKPSKLALRKQEERSVYDSDFF